MWLERVKKIVMWTPLLNINIKINLYNLTIAQFNDALLRCNL